MLSRGCVATILYAENTYQYLGLLGGCREPRRGHLPPSDLAAPGPDEGDWHVRRLSAAICLGRTQMGSGWDRRG